MTADLGLNLAGVERVFELENLLDGDGPQGPRARAPCRPSSTAEVERLEALRRELRAEIVPYAGRGGPRLALTRATREARAVGRQNP